MAILLYCKCAEWEVGIRGGPPRAVGYRCDEYRMGRRRNIALGAGKGAQCKVEVT